MADDEKPIDRRRFFRVGLREFLKPLAQSAAPLERALKEFESIGKEMSMGCVRMNAEDVEVVYEMLMGRSSVVKIVP